MEERLAEIACEAQPREALADLRAERFVDLEPLLARRLPEDRVVQLVEPEQLGNRMLVVIDAQIDEDVRQAAVTAVLRDNEERCGLLAPAVAARGLPGGEALDQARRQRAACVRLESAGDRVDRVALDENVPLRRVAVADPPSGPVVAVLAGEGRATAVCVDHA